MAAPLAPVTVVEWHTREPDEQIDARLARMLLGPAVADEEES